MEQQFIQKDELLKFDPKSSFTILSKGHVVSVGFTDITHVSKHGNETIIHTPYGKWRTYHSLQEILDELPVSDFFRVHKSQVVALKFIDGFEGPYVIVQGKPIPMTHYYRMLLIRQLRDILNQGYQLIIDH